MVGGGLIQCDWCPFKEENTRLRQGPAGERMATWLWRQSVEGNQEAPRVNSHWKKPERGEEGFY